MPPSDDRNYEVGRGKPPRHTRFRKGQSGNPRGRPRGSKDLDALLAKVLEQRVPVVVDGKRKRISKLEAIITQLVNRAAASDWRFVNLLLGYLPRSDDRSVTLPIGPDGKPQIPITIWRDIVLADREGGGND